jgi:uncharacterized membrane protein
MTRMRFARGLLAAHGVALAFALIGLLIAIPHPELWSEMPGASSIFRFGMEYAGALHIILGAGAVAAFGGAVLGWRRTTIFFVAPAGRSAPTSTPRAWDTSCWVACPSRSPSPGSTWD